MMTADELVNEWVATRDRLAEHIRLLQPVPTLHIAGDFAAEAHKRSVTLLTNWQTELDELVAGLLMDSVATETDR